MLVEAQTKRDPDKPDSWAYYLSYLRNRYGHQPILLVVCRDRATALWASRPFRIGHPAHPNLTLTPLVLGPHNVPKITDYERAAADVPFAVFSAITHSNDPDAGAILEVLAEALKKTDDETRTTCAELAASGLEKTPAAKIGRNLMDAGLFSFRGFVAEGLREEGRVQERVAGVLRVLGARGIPVDDTARERIADCTDMAMLDTWFEKAIAATSVDELFTDPPQD
ncbi:hypothetical protein [Streptomyces sp. 184]|uniref:hypothetical protein n=1 Tax=Streptomyces sp. 184 TaxID=1827526 RepID=UPI003892C6F8